jgi:hypothetical protein
MTVVTGLGWFRILKMIVALYESSSGDGITSTVCRIALGSNSKIARLRPSSILRVVIESMGSNKSLLMLPPKLG